MFNGQLSTEEREQMLAAKERAVGSIQNDRVDSVSQVEYLRHEIKETRGKRRSHSLPLFAIGVVTLVFAAAGATPLTQSIGILLGVSALVIGFLIVTKRTKKLSELREKLKAAEASEDEKKEKT